VNSDTSIVGMAEESSERLVVRIGIRRTRSRASCGVPDLSWWSVPRCAATAARARLVVSALPEADENVFTGPEAAFLISATTRRSRSLRREMPRAGHR